MPDIEQENTNKNYQKKDLLNTQPKEGSHKKSTEKKVFIFLVIFVFLSLLFGVWWLGRQIRSPFEPSRDQANTNSQLSSATTEVPKIESLRTQDTDQDGLNDYDELYLYRTSPYISDSDSDTISDKLEIDQGTDPNCPKGETCGREASEASNINNNINIESSLPADVTNLSASELRQIMRDAGASEELLSKIKDEDLLEIYQEILIAEEGSELGLENTNGSLLSNQESVSGNIDYLDYQTLIDLKPPEIRQLLIEGGVPEETLNQIDDETLQQIYDESLSQNLKGITP